MRYFHVAVTERPEFCRSIYTTTRGRAKYLYLLDLWECWPGMGFQHLTARAFSPIILPEKVFVPKREQILPAIIARLIAFLEPVQMTRPEWEHSYPLWAKGGEAWRIADLGGTFITKALVWYHHVFSPGSRESSPPVILRALIETAAPEYLTPARKTP